MHFEYSEGLPTPAIAEAVREMLAFYDTAFLPPLSKRISSTQKDLKDTGTTPDHDQSADDGITDYFNALCAQKFILAMDRDTVAGFLSFKEDYTCRELGGEQNPCTYVTTVLVSEKYRGLRLTYDLYNELFAYVIDRGEVTHPIATRTWKSDVPAQSNDAHIHILEQLGFKLVKTLHNDRGDGIDTVYFEKRFSEEQFNLLERLQSSHTLSPFIIAGILFVLTIITALAYVFADFGEVGGELLLAFTTSLLVSAICLIIDASSQYKLAKNEQYLLDMKEFGIEGLSFDKQLLLIDKIHNAQDDIRITGCRHILNSSMAAYLQRATAKGIKIQVLSCPPWCEAYNLIYDDPEKTLNNYIKLFRMMLICDEQNDCANVAQNCEFRFSNKPFFNDIYIIDDTLITSPYSYFGGGKGDHLTTPAPGAESATHYVTARDFFTLIARNDSTLSRNMQNEYGALWDSAEYVLDKTKFIRLFPDTSYLFRGDSADKEAVDAKYRENIEKIKTCMIALAS